MIPKPGVQEPVSPPPPGLGDGDGDGPADGDDPGDGLGLPLEAEVLLLLGEGQFDWPPADGAGELGLAPESAPVVPGVDPPGIPPCKAAMEQFAGFPDALPGDCGIAEATPVLVDAGLGLSPLFLLSLQANIKVIVVRANENNKRNCNIMAAISS